MKTSNSYAVRAVKWGATLLSALLLSACMESAPVKPAPPPPPEPEKPAYFKEISPAAAHLAQTLAKKMAGNTSLVNPQLVVDEFFNEKTAEVSAAGRTLQGLLIESVNKVAPAWAVSPLGGKALQKAQWAVMGTVNLVPGKEGSNEKWVSIKAVINDIRSGKALTQAEVFVDAARFSAEPTRFYKDAPMYLPAARLAEKRANMGDMAPGALAEKLKTEALLADARNAYENEDFSTAEKLFAEILQQGGEKNFSALSGLYQSQLRANRLKDAENTFGLLVDSGLDAGSLSVKFLFKVRSTDFLESGDLAAQYPIWVRQIALKLRDRKQCLNVNGHASRSGSDEFNNRLSLQRATRIAAMLKKTAPPLASRLKAFGKGYSENIVGSGTDDALDAIDRRVEFAIAECA